MIFKKIILIASLILFFGFPQPSFSMHTLWPAGLERMIAEMPQILFQTTSGTERFRGVDLSVSTYSKSNLSHRPLSSLLGQITFLYDGGVPMEFFVGQVKKNINNHMVPQGYGKWTSTTSTSTQQGRNKKPIVTQITKEVFGEFDGGRPTKGEMVVTENANGDVRKAVYQGDFTSPRDRAFRYGQLLTTEPLNPKAQKVIRGQLTVNEVPLTNHTISDLSSIFIPHTFNRSPTDLEAQSLAKAQEVSQRAKEIMYYAERAAQKW